MVALLQCIEISDEYAMKKMLLVYWTICCLCEQQNQEFFWVENIKIFPRIAVCNPLLPQQHHSLSWYYTCHLGCYPPGVHFVFKLPLWKKWRPVIRGHVSMGRFSKSCQKIGTITIFSNFYFDVKMSKSHFNFFHQFSSCPSPESFYILVLVPPYFIVDHLAGEYIPLVRENVTAPPPISTCVNSMCGGVNTGSIFIHLSTTTTEQLTCSDMPSSCSEEEEEGVPSKESSTPWWCQLQCHPLIRDHPNTEPSSEDEVVPSTVPLQCPFSHQTFQGDASSDADAEYVVIREDTMKQTKQQKLSHLFQIPSQLSRTKAMLQGKDQIRNKGLNKGEVSSFFFTQHFVNGDN